MAEQLADRLEDRGELALDVQQRQQCRERTKGRADELAERAQVERDDAHVLDAREQRAERGKLGELADLFLGSWRMAAAQPAAFDAPAVLSDALAVGGERPALAAIELPGEHEQRQRDENLRAGREDVEGVGSRDHGTDEHLATRKQCAARRN